MRSWGNHKPPTERTRTTIPDWRLISVFIILYYFFILIIINYYYHYYYLLLLLLLLSYIYICICIILYWLLLHFTPFTLMIYRFYWHVLLGSLLERELTSSVENMGFPLSNPSPLRWWIWIIIVHEISCSIPRIIFITYSFNQLAVLANFPSLTNNYIIWHVPQVLALQAESFPGTPWISTAFCMRTGGFLTLILVPVVQKTSSIWWRNYNNYKLESINHQKNQNPVFIIMFQ